MNPNQPQNDALQSAYNPLKVMQPGERVVCELRRHPIGLFGIYFMLAVVVVAAVCAVALAPRIFLGITSQNQAVLALGAVIVCAIVGLFTYVGSIVYKGNRWVVTTDSITQIDQTSLFSKQTSQLSMANLEDVTVEQNGFLPSMLGYGRLRAESAGQRGKFVFDYCPRPNDCAKQIIAAHEAYIAENPSETYAANRALANAAAFNQAYGQPVQGSAQTGQPFDPTQPNGQRQ